MWRPLQCWGEGAAGGGGGQVSDLHGSVSPQPARAARQVHPQLLTQGPGAVWDFVPRGCLHRLRCLIPPPAGVDTRQLPCPSRGPGQRYGAGQQPADHPRTGHCLRASGRGPLPPSVQARRPWPAVDRAEEKVGRRSGAGFESRSPPRPTPGQGVQAWRAGSRARHSRTVPLQTLGAALSTGCVVLVRATERAGTAHSPSARCRGKRDVSLPAGWASRGLRWDLERPGCH